MKIIAFCFFAFCFFLHSSAQKIYKGTIHILYTPNQSANTFIPSQNIGGAVDGHFKGDINEMLTPVNIEAMKLVGLKPVSYRLRTELGDETWHWNPKGVWSNSAKNQGYWISDSVSTKPIEMSHGYRLPRRGNTRDQANDNGYSKISDGDTSSFWKSNPYLDKYYTRESNALHPQWVIVDLGKLKTVNAICIKWGNPYPLSYKIDYAQYADPDYFDPYQTDIWQSFPNNFFENPKGENKIIRISEKSHQIRFLRILFTESSYTTTDESGDIRDSLGFAIKEMQIGLMDEKGKFHDWMHHSPDHRQSTIYVSSTDPWHRAQDLDLTAEQVGIDRFFASGLAAEQPALMPAALLYDTPENVLALVKYVRAKHYPVEEIEMGEEPEGQLVSPVDYASLYYQWGKQIKNIQPNIRMGGPGFASLSFTKDDNTTFTESKWTSLFLNYLKRHNSINLFNFFSFEWYPFDDLCAPSAPQLASAPGMLSIALKNFKNNILPQNTPLYLTEYGYSASEGKTEVEMEGALMYADILGQFLELGGSKNFLYGYEPAFLQQVNCGYGNNMLFGLGLDGKIAFKTAAFYCMQMLTHYWAQPADSLLEMFPFTGSIKNSKKQPLVVSYALRGPKGKWSVMLINKDPDKTWNVNIDVENTLSKKIIAWHPEHLIQYSKEQYHWVNNGINSHPLISLPPVGKKINGSSNISLPPYSLTVIN
ncbi:MAG: discoidin domain-containing protein [Ginsengibacter sp.]